MTDISVTYNRPVARGRRLFGGIVRWSEVWHPGADSATTIQFNRAVLVEGRPLAAGRYTLWTIPDSLQWTVIFSRAVNVFLRLSVIALLVYVGLIGMTVVTAKIVPKGFIPQQDKGYLVVNAQLPDGSALGRRSSWPT